MSDTRSLHQGKLADGDSLNIWRCPACGSVIAAAWDDDAPCYCNGYDMGPDKAASSKGGHRQRRMQILTVEVMGHD